MRNAVFVAMPFNPVFFPVWQKIKKACEYNNLKCCRVDQIPQIDNIHEAIFREIDNSDIVIVDFSPDSDSKHPNPNVVTEATYAKIQKKPLVILSQLVDSLPFDWKIYRATVYENNQHGLEYLEEVLKENLAGVKERIAIDESDGNSISQRLEIEVIESQTVEIEKPEYTGFSYLQEQTYSCGGQSHTISIYLHKKTGMKFCLIPEGEFLMQYSVYIKGETTEYSEVKKIKPFLICQTPVTQFVWARIMKYNYSYFRGEQMPVHCISWHEAKDFCDLTDLDLPDEKQWEYACKAGTQSTYYWGEHSVESIKYAWYGEPWRTGSTHDVALKNPNAFGLYDMCGNVLEWCSNYYNDQRFPKRVTRGGDWYAGKHCLKSSYRVPLAEDFKQKNLGFRAIYDITSEAKKANANILVISSNEYLSKIHSSENNNIPGFRYLEEKSYSCGGQTHLVKNYTHIATNMIFSLIPGGKFLMEYEYYDDDNNCKKFSEEKNVKSFLISKTPVTQSVWLQFMRYDDFCFRGGQKPVESVSWNDCIEFCNKVNLDLPSEAQWEYACRAGTKSIYYWGDDNAFQYAWFGEKWDYGSTHDVAQKKPNAFGLYDMCGNVIEWCLDWENYEHRKVVRGGSWYSDWIESNWRGTRNENSRRPHMGFRVVYNFPG